MNAVGIDVSKGKSTVVILRPFGEIVVSPHEVKHTDSEITALIKQIKSIEGETRIVMEHTGHYYEQLLNRFAEAGLFATAVNPKLIKDFSTNSLRKVKTDKADSVKIARYALDRWEELIPYTEIDGLRSQLKQLNRQFLFYTKNKIALRNNLITLMDQTFPGINTLFTGATRPDGSQQWVDFVETYWHADCVRKMSKNAFITHYGKWCEKHGYKKSMKKSEQVYMYAKDLVCVLPKDETTKMLVQQAVEQVRVVSVAIEHYRSQMNSIASKLPEYEVVMGMTGIGISLGPQLMAEIGDIKRFSHKGALTAYAGVDPEVNQSGMYNQISTRTTKRGSAELRRTLYMVAEVLLKTKPKDDPVYMFLSKKRAEGKPYFVYMTATANKFLRVYYGKVNEYLDSIEER